MQRAVIQPAVFQGAATRVAALLLLVVLIAGVAAGNAHADEPVDAGAAAADSAVADRLMHAFNLIGTRYHRRGTSPQTGFDCSGFIGWVFRAAHGVALPRTAHEMFSLASARADAVERDLLAPGDLVFFRIGRLGKRIDHVGLYAGDGRFLHAPARGGEVRMDTLDLPYWRQHYAGARRVQVPAAPLPDRAGLQHALSPVMQNDEEGRVADAGLPDALADTMHNEPTTPGELPP